MSLRPGPGEAAEEWVIFLQLDVVHSWLSAAEMEDCLFNQLISFQESVEKNNRMHQQFCWLSRCVR